MLRGTPSDHLVLSSVPQVPVTIVDPASSALEVAAVLLAGLSGMIVASRKHMDIVGTYTLAGVTAFGGGTLRDVLLDRRPLFWVEHWEYLAVLLVLCVAFVYSRPVYESASRWERRFDFVDALGLAAYGLLGASAALAAGSPLFVCALFGVITATFGGVTRDVISMEIPQLFRPGGMYATAVFLGAWLYFALLRAGVGESMAHALAFACIVGLRMVSLRYGVTLPKPLWLRELQRTDEHGTPH